MTIQFPIILLHQTVEQIPATLMEVAFIRLEPEHLPLIQTIQLSRIKLQVTEMEIMFELTAVVFLAVTPMNLFSLLIT